MSSTLESNKGIVSGLGVVFEDAPNGIRSGKAAGCKIVAFLTTHSKEEVEACQPDFLVPDMSR
jgi:beta-phosphoglucomutase-like phosphatase (HAD superfamily)